MAGKIKQNTLINHADSERDGNFKLSVDFDQSYNDELNKKFSEIEILKAIRPNV